MEKKRIKINRRTIYDWDDFSCLNINSLPEEILLHIFSFLQQDELCQIARVCKMWNELSKYQGFWRQVNVKFSRNRGYKSKVVKKLAKILPSCVTHIKLNFQCRSYWTGNLSFKKFAMILHRRCPNLYSLIFHHAVFSDTLPQVIDLCAQYLQSVQLLVLRYSKFSYHSEEGKSNIVSTIRHLDLHGWNSVPFTEFLFEMPYLKKLNLARTYIDDSWFVNIIAYLQNLEVLDLGMTWAGSGTFKAIRDYGINLVELYLCFTRITDDDLKWDDSIQAFPRLKLICLKWCSDLTCVGIIAFVNSCPSLQDVFVNADMADSFTDYVTHFKPHKNNLEIIKAIPQCAHYADVEFT